MKIFSKKEKTIVTIVSVFCFVFAALGGIWAARAITGMYLGEQITFSSLDEVDQSGSVNILLLGVDEGGLRSDTIMLASIDKETGSVNILSIPRDTRIPMGKGYQKINAAIGIGAQEVRKGKLEQPEELSVKKVKELTGLQIHYFACVNFEGFKEIIDSLGGVDFEVPFDMKYDDPAQNLHIDLKAGMQHLDGQAAHDFVRFRKGNPGHKGYAMGDLGRIEAQQAFVKALIQQKVKPQYVLKAPEIFETIEQNVRTNYTAKDLLQHMGMIGRIDSEKVEMHQLPGGSKTISGISYYLCDYEKTEELINTKFNPTDEP